MSYHQFINHETGESYGSFEVYQMNEYIAGEISDNDFYWWACFPGCMPDGEPNGPFPTEQEAIDDALELG